MQKAFANLDTEDEINYRFTKARTAPRSAQAALSQRAAMRTWRARLATHREACHHRGSDSDSDGGTARGCVSPRRVSPLSPPSPLLSPSP